jgi:hypothetical protein
MENLVIEDGVMTKEQAETIQIALDEFLAVQKESEALLKTQGEALNASTVAIDTLMKVNEHCTETVKNIFSILGSRKDKFKDDKEMEELMNGLAKFVIDTTMKGQ